MASSPRDSEVSFYETAQKAAEILGTTKTIAELALAERQGGLDLERSAQENERYWKDETLERRWGIAKGKFAELERVMGDLRPFRKTLSHQGMAILQYANEEMMRRVSDPKIVQNMKDKDYTLSLHDALPI